MAKLKRKISLMRRMMTLSVILFLFSSKTIHADTLNADGTFDGGGNGGQTSTASQTFDDGSTLSVTTHDSGAVTVTATNATDSGPGGPGGPKIICTELYKQGLLPANIFQADQQFGIYLREHYPLVYLGYIAWAVYIVRLMKLSPAFTRLVSLIATPWAINMAYRQGVVEKNSYLGASIMLVGGSICFAVGYVVNVKRKFTYLQKLS